MKAQAESSLASVKRAQWALLSVCAAIVVGSVLPPKEDTEDALAETTFLLSLQSVPSGWSIDFIEMWGRQAAEKIVSPQIKELLNGSQYTVVWEERQEITRLKDALYSKLDEKSDPTSEMAQEFYTALARASKADREKKTQPAFNQPEAHIGRECATANELPLFKVAHPAERSDGWEGFREREVAEVWVNPSEVPLEDVLRAWELLQEIHYWFPVSQDVGAVVIQDHAVNLKLPARLESRDAKANCEDLRFYIDSVSVAGQYHKGELFGLVKDQQQVARAVEISGDLSGSGASEGTTWHDWYFLDDSDRPKTVHASLELAFSAIVRIVNGQDLLLKVNPSVRRPRGFRFGNAATSFEALSDYLAKNPTLLRESLQNLSTRLQQDVENEKSNKSISVLGLEIPASRLGLIGIVGLIFSNIYLALHLGHFARLIQSTDVPEQTWLGMMPYASTYYAVVVALCAVPVATCIWLSYLMWNELYALPRSITGAIGLVFFIAIFALAYRVFFALHTIRKRSVG